LQATTLSPKQIAAALSSLYGRPVNCDDVNPLTDKGSVQNPADQTGKFTAPAQQGGDCFVLTSSPSNPDIVARGVRNIETIHARLSPSAGEKLVKPYASGYVEGVSYALWPVLRPLGQSRLIQSFQKRRLTPKILNWLYDIAATTRSVNSDIAHIETNFVEPLTAAANHHGLSAKIRETAGAAIAKINSGALQPTNCMQHGDFWLGNIMLAGADTPGRPEFVVIDWGGANASGFPFFDLAKMALSLNIPKAQSVREFSRHCALFKCDQEDSLAYFVCAIGSLSQNLEYFPEEKFIEMSQSLFDYILSLTAKK